MNKVQSLIEAYLKDQIHLNEFQSRLRPALGDRDLRSNEEDDFIKMLDNKIELILYTVPESQQRAEVEKLIPLINRFTQAQASMDI